MTPSGRGASGAGSSASSWTLARTARGRGGRRTRATPRSASTPAGPVPGTRSRFRTSWSPTSPRRLLGSRLSAAPSSTPASGGRSARTPKVARSGSRSALGRGAALGFGLQVRQRLVEVILERLLHPAAERRGDVPSQGSLVWTSTPVVTRLEPPHVNGSRGTSGGTNLSETQLTSEHPYTASHSHRAPDRAGSGDLITRRSRVQIPPPLCPSLRRRGPPLGGSWRSPACDASNRNLTAFACLADL